MNQDSGRPPVFYLIMCYIDFIVFFVVDIVGEPMSFLLAMLASILQLGDDSHVFRLAISFSILALLSVGLVRKSVRIQNGYLVEKVRSMPHPRSYDEPSTCTVFARREIMPIGVCFLSILTCAAALVVGFSVPFDAADPSLLEQMLVIVLTIISFALTELLLRYCLFTFHADWFVFMVLKSSSTEKHTSIDLDSNNDICIRREPLVFEVYFTPSGGSERRKRRR